MFLLQAALFATLFLAIIGYVIWANVKHHKGGHDLREHDSRNQGIISRGPDRAWDRSGYGRDGYSYIRRVNSYNRR